MADQRCYANRELSWLKFNQRVLEEAQDPANPLCERLSFLSIFQSNLDEFFMVRVGSLFEKMQVSEKIRENKTNMTCREQLSAIFERVRQMLHDKDNTYRDLQNCLKTEGVEIVDFHTISQQEADYLQSYFRSEIEPLLSPQIVSKSSRSHSCKTRKSMRLSYWRKKEAKKSESFRAAVRYSRNMFPCRIRKTALF